MPIEDIVDLCGPNFDARIQDYDVPLFSNGYHAMRSPETMMEYIKKGLPDEYARRSADNAKNYVGSIGADWCGTSSPKRKSQQRSSSKISDDTKIQIILVDDTNEDERHTFDIGSSTTLKTVFNEYAEKRSVSLRSLRFSYAGKTLFLSTVGNRTPEEMQMRDQDVIRVHDINTNASSSQESSNNTTNQTNKSSSSKKSKSSKSSSKKNKGKKNKNKGTKEVHPIYSSTLSLEEYKAQHSKVLSKLHEEVQSQLKDIRMRLNALDLERQPPKQKKKKKNKNKSKLFGCVELQVLPTNPGVGGKAGKPYFPVQVGEVQNLYKTTKPTILSSRSSSSNTPVLDLHGCTREEALVKLDDSLNVWIDIAQRGNYPFVMSAEIVCGCGNQILSETVQEWIKTSRNVCNTPKNLISRN